MSATAAALTVAAVLAVSLLAGCWQIRRAGREEPTRERIVREAHERAELARDLDDMELVWSLAAGCERLRDAIHNEQQKGADDA